MFERFTEQARQAVFFARYRADKVGHTEIETLDLLHGIASEWATLREALGLAVDLLQEERGRPGIRQTWWERLSRKRSSLAREMPISNDCKSAFRHALESAERADSAWITRRHLLIGAARADAAIGKLLGEKNINPEEFPLPEDEDWQPTPTARVGIGYDFHRLAEGRPLILGGVEIPFGKGLVGHSDGDVLTHAVCDALLGAAGLGDLGQHFPDHDPRWKDASSLDLLARVVALLKERGLQIMQIDSVIVAEQPALAPHFARMREQLAKTLGIQPAQVNVKAKTTEGLEALGRGEAMAAQAVALLELRGTTLVS